MDAVFSFEFRNEFRALWFAPPFILKSSVVFDFCIKLGLFALGWGD